MVTKLNVALGGPQAAWPVYPTDIEWLFAPAMEGTVLVMGATVLGFIIGPEGNERPQGG